MTIDQSLLDCLYDVLSPTDGKPPVPIIMLPSTADPRAFLPVGHAPSAARILRTHFAGGRLRRRAGTLVLSALVATRIAQRLPTWRMGTVSDVPDRLFHEWVRTLVPQHSVGLVLIGPRRANRKPVVLVTDSAGKLSLVAKIGYNEVTRPLVRHEAMALRDVASSLEPAVHVPSVIGATRIGNLEMMAMLPLPELDRRRSLSRASLIEVVRAISSVKPGDAVDLRETLRHPRIRPLAPAVERISARVLHAPAGSAHGDLHPGNLGVAADGRPTIWDWERWVAGMPVGFDLLHHDLQTWVTIEGLNPRDAAQRLITSAPEILEPLGIGRDLAGDIARDYLVRLANRYVTDAQDQAGSRLGAVEDWIFPVIRDDHHDKEHQ